MPLAISSNVLARGWSGRDRGPGPTRHCCIPTHSNHHTKYPQGTVYNDMDHRKFPWDSDTVELHIAPKVYDASKVVLVLDSRETSLAVRHHLAEWDSHPYFRAIETQIFPEGTNSELQVAYACELL